jgi:hypothetical protein
MEIHPYIIHTNLRGVLKIFLNIIYEILDLLLVHEYCFYLCGNFSRNTICIDLFDINVLC